jgi:hypothetical protein
MMTPWAVLWVWALQIAVWLCLFFLLRLMCAPVFAMPEPVAVYLYTYAYTVSTVVLCLRSLTVTIGKWSLDIAGLLDCDKRQGLK